MEPRLEVTRWSRPRRSGARRRPIPTLGRRIRPPVFGVGALVAVLALMLTALPGSAAAEVTGPTSGGPSSSNAPAPAVCPLGLAVSDHLDPAGGRPLTVCSGYVASFDGTPLSTDVTIPDGMRGPLPLMVMLNGWGDNKSNFEATSLSGNGSPYTYHWNNAWFASQGFAVLNYTARGFWHSCGKVPVSGSPSAGGIGLFDPVYLTEPGCAGKESWTHLADRRYEVRDTQTLVGKLVDAGVARPDQIVVTGDSYGGGQSWMLAMSKDQVMRRNGTTEPWRSPKGTPIHLAAAVPLFGWTDLLQALADNGAASIAQTPAADSPAAASHVTPYGVEKLSYVTGLFGLGAATAQYAPPGVDPSADLTSWYAAIGAGEPYSVDPVAAEAATQLTRYRSAWYMPVPPPSKAVPIFTVQGLTDPLFPSTQSLQMEQRLRRAEPGYPVWTVLADVGHSYADNPPAVWHRILDEANTWLGDVLAHQQPIQPKMQVATVACVAGQTTTWYAADHFRRIADTVLDLQAATTGQTTSAGANPVSNVETDPIANSGCRTLPESEAAGPGAASFELPLSGPAATRGVTLMGAPVVRAKAVLVGHNAELAASLWEVDPASGSQTLVTRSVQRLVGYPGQVLDLAFELWSTAWYVAPGDELQLQLTQNDAPTWRPDNEPSALSFSGVQVKIPAVVGG